MSSDKRNYYEKISLHNKTPEEAKIITENFNKNINMAYKVASKYYKTGYWDYEEALQIAQMGLWKACLIWDPNQYRLSTLAYNIMNRDFMDYDRQQKKQPDILFNIEENCVTDDLSLGDVLEDPNADVTSNYQQNEELQELNQDIIYILDDIAEDFKISKGIVKIVYIVYLEANQADSQLTLRNLDFIPKNTIKQIIAELQERLAKFYYND